MSAPTQADIDKAQADILGEAPSGAAVPAEAAAAPAKAAAPPLSEAERQFMALQTKNAETKKESENGLRDLAIAGGALAGAGTQYKDAGYDLDIRDRPARLSRPPRLPHQQHRLRRLNLPRLRHPLVRQGLRLLITKLPTYKTSTRNEKLWWTPSWLRSLVTQKLVRPP